MKFDYTRRWGVEIEVNALDGRDHPEVEGAQPDGIQLVANVVARSLNTRCEIHKWGPTHGNNVWAIKPDGSCGMEVCSPVSKGLYGIGQAGVVVDAMKDTNAITADKRCSLHVHVEIADMTPEQVAAILARWVKCEFTMLLAMPDYRKRNRYCQVIGMSDLLRADQLLAPTMLVTRLGAYKYYTANVFHYVRNKRPTIEFRIADNRACLDSFYLRNWVKLILHFVETALQAGYPSEYEAGNQQSGYLWLFPEETIKFLGFDQNDLCPELMETRNWLVKSINENYKSKLGGIWDDKVADRVWPHTLAA